MSEVTTLESKGQKAIKKARQEVEQEDLNTAVGKLKKKLRELQDAKTVVANIEREITDLEEAISQGNA